MIDGTLDAVVSPGRARATFVVLGVSVGAFAMLQNLLFPVLTTLQEELNTSPSAVSWVFNAYLLSAAVFTPVMGRIGDLVGRRRIFIATMLALCLGSVLGAFATSIGVMIAARAIQGIGGGALPIAFGILRDTQPRDRVTTAVGRLASLTAVAGGAALIVAGPILEFLGFRWLFWIPTLVTLGCAVGARLVIPYFEPVGRARVSLLPPVLLSALLISLLLGLTEGSQWHWTSGRFLGVETVAVVAGGLWVVSERRARVPLIDLGMMRQRVMWTTNLVSFVVGVALYAAAAYVPVFVQTPSSAGYGFSASVTESGIILLPNALAAFAIGLLMGRLTVAVGSRALIIAGCLVGAGAMAMFAFLNHLVIEIYVASALLGIGLGLSFAATASLIVHSVPPDQTGVANGISANFRLIGGAVGTGIMATVLAASAPDGGRPTEHAFAVGFAVLGAAMLAGAVAAALIPDTRADRPTDAAAEVAGALSTSASLADPASFP